MFIINKTALVNTTLLNISDVILDDDISTERDITKLIPFILLGAFFVGIIILGIYLCKEDSRDQKVYLEGVKARKNGDTVEWG